MGLIDWFRHHFQGGEHDPLTAFDRGLEALDRRGAELRQAAAELFASRQALEEQRARALAVGRELSPGGPGVAAEREHAFGRARELDAALTRIADQAAALKASAGELGLAAERLRQERASAASRFEAARGGARAPPSGEAVPHAVASREDLEVGPKPTGPE